MAGVDWCKCSFVEVGFWGGSVSTEMPGSASTETGGSRSPKYSRKTTIVQSLFLKITISHFEGGPLWV